MKVLAALLLAASVSVFAERSGQEDSVSYVWQYSGRIYGTLKIPPRYKRDETEHYVEGFVTRIHYGDGSTIILQKGGMYLVPMLQTPEYKLNKSDESADRRIRRGKIKVEGEELFWREDNFKGGQSPKSVPGGLIGIFPPNVAFDRVPKDRVALFEKALDSFVRIGGEKIESFVHSERSGQR
jgi:hypothetical protein